MANQYDCYKCKNQRPCLGSGHHISCIKPDPHLEGNPRGIKNGWFLYPYNFDPVWIANTCRHYEPLNPTAEEKEAMKATKQTQEDTSARLVALRDDIVAVMKKHNCNEDGIAVLFVGADRETNDMVTTSNLSPERRAQFAQLVAVRAIAEMEAGE